MFNNELSKIKKVCKKNDYFRTNNLLYHEEIIRMKQFDCEIKGKYNKNRETKISKKIIK